MQQANAWEDRFTAVCSESSDKPKLIYIFCSCRTAGGTEKIRRVWQVLFVHTEENEKGKSLYLLLYVGARNVLVSYIGACVAVDTSHPLSNYHVCI